MSDAPTRDQNKFLVRMPEGMRDRLREAAEANGRSMNAEIVQRLEDSFSRKLQRLDRNVERMEDRFESLERQLQRVVASLNMMRLTSKEMRQHPEGLTRDEEVRREGREFYLKHWREPFTNPYPEGTDDHEMFLSGYQMTAINHIAEWDADEHQRMDKLFVGRARELLLRRKAFLTTEKEAANADVNEEPSNAPAEEEKLQPSGDATDGKSEKPLKSVSKPRRNIKPA